MRFKNHSDLLETPKFKMAAKFTALRVQIGAYATIWHVGCLFTGFLGRKIQKWCENYISDSSRVPNSKMAVKIAEIFGSKVLYRRLTSCDILIPTYFWSQNPNITFKIHPDLVESQKSNIAAKFASTKVKPAAFAQELQVRSQFTDLLRHRIRK